VLGRLGLCSSSGLTPNRELDQRRHRADDSGVIFRSHASEPARRAIGALTTIALLSFGAACAWHGAWCDVPREARTDSQRLTAADHGCGGNRGCCGRERCCGRDGAAERSGGKCAHASLCCSSWAPAWAAPGVAAPQPAFSALPRVIFPPRPTRDIFAARIPIPFESPPPPLSILRL